jgi:predicted TIM-barrel fold metal-dependent hydrolase
MGDIIDVNAVFGGMPSAPSDAGLDDLLKALDLHGITACCALSTIGVLYDHTIGNGASKAAAARSPRLVPVATINPTRCISELGWIAGLSAEGYRMARFFPLEQQWEPEDAAFAAVLAVLARSPLPMMIGVAGSGIASRVMRVVGDYPGTIVLSGVSGGMLAEAVALMRAHARLHIETSNLVACGAVRALVDAAGADRVLFGTGAPARSVQGGLAVIRQAGLPDVDTEQILAANARRALSV